jgi:hypothetical protein
MPVMSRLGEELPELTVLMPCLNEAETLEFCIREAQEASRCAAR